MIPINQKRRKKIKKEKKLVIQAIANGVIAAIFSFVALCILYFPTKRTGRSLFDYSNEWSVIIVAVLIAIPLFVSLISFIISMLKKANHTK